MTLSRRDREPEEAFREEGSGSVDRKLSMIKELLVDATPIEAKYIVRTILGDLADRHCAGDSERCHNLGHSSVKSLG
jgi:ATP-dependent DNA ligase